MQLDGTRVGGAAAQPRRLAILAVLARAGARGVTRERLQALLWPDADDERGRRVLTQAVYALRRDLGSEAVILGTKELRLSAELATSDIQEFEKSLAEPEPVRAVAVYEGPFLDGFRLPGADEFERWVEEERTELAHRYGVALERLARGCAERGDASAAAGWWRRRAAHVPLNAAVAVELMKALTAAGDRAGALQHARIYEALVQQELDLPPDPAVVALADQLRQAAEAGSVAGAPLAPAPTAAAPRPAREDAETSPVETIPVTAAAPAAASFGIRRRQRPRAYLLAAALGAVVILVATALVLRRQAAARGEVAPLLAVGLIADYRAAPAADLARPLADLLATNLARVPGLHVLSTARMYELAEHLDQGEAGKAGAMSAAAQQAGAAALIEGGLYALPDGSLRLDLRRIQLATGTVQAAHSVTGRDIFALADSGTARLAHAAGLAAPAGTVADVTTRSEMAYRLYTEGLDNFYRGDRAGAERLFQSALAEDSTFAMAAYYLARAGPGRRGPLLRNFERALRLADRASDRERLIIRAGWAAIASHPGLLAIADTLAVRYPQEVEGHFYAGRALIEAAEYPAAVARLQRAIAMDSLAFRGPPGARCIACDALGDLISAYASSDSLDAAVRWAEHWTRLQPQSAVAWQRLREVLTYAQRPEAALEAHRRATTIDPALHQRMDFYAYHYLYQGDFATAEPALREAASTGAPERRLDAHWYLAIGLRAQGRFREALEEAKRYRRLAAELEPGTRTPGYAALQQAQVLLEMGRHLEAGALFDSISLRWAENEAPSYIARHRIWSLSHGANALAALGDTLALRARIDTLTRLAGGSALARDRRLHFHARGLLLARRGRDLEAVTAFRSAMVSPNLGYGRTNLELARVLLRLQRAPEAVATLQAALRSSLEGPNLYVTRTELHAALGDAWLAAGGRDSASVHYRATLRAWAHADSVLSRRRDQLRQRVAALTPEAPRP